MVLPLLGLLPTLFSAIGTATELFDAGKQVYESITGKPSAAATPDELRADVYALPDDRKAAWAEQMKATVEQYKAETDRLRNEQGDVTDTLVAKLDQKTADKVALLRMTTRPWAVRKLVHYMLVPLYLLAIDGALAFANILLRFFHAGPGEPKTLDLLAATFFSGDSIYASMYAQGVAPAATIVVTYMTLRQIEKSGNPLQGAADAIGNLVKRFR